MISNPRDDGNHMRIFVDSSGTVIGGNEKSTRVSGGAMGKGSVKLNKFGAPVPGQVYSGNTYKHILKKVYVVGSKDKPVT